MFRDGDRIASVGVFGDVAPEFLLRIGDPHLAWIPVNVVGDSVFFEFINRFAVAGVGTPPVMRPVHDFESGFFFLVAIQCPLSFL